MLPWFLPKGSNQIEEWYENITIPDFRIKPTKSGYIDDKTAFDWLCSFHEASKNRVQKGRPRLLLMDNHGSHSTIEFISFCEEKLIIPFFFLPHTTHLCQPLDGEAFQCLKHYFRTANNEVMIWGGSVARKRDFFRMIHQVREKAFIQRIIRSSFRSRGIYPFDPEAILAPLRRLESEGTPLRIFTPSPPPDISSSVTNSPPDTIARVNKLNTKLIKGLENQNQQMKRYIQRSMDANSYLTQELDLIKASFKKSQFHKEARNEPRNGKSILRASNSVLGPTNANRMIKKRQDVDSKKRQRQQAKHAKELEDEAQAQKARDLAEAEHEAQMIARNGGGPNWYMDSRGSYL